MEKNFSRLIVFFFSFVLFLFSATLSSVTAQDCASWTCGKQSSTGCSTQESIQETGQSCSYGCPPGYDCVTNKKCSCGTGGGGGAVCNNCGGGAGIQISSIQDRGSSFVVNWTADSGGWNRACLNNGLVYYYVIYVGTDYSAVNGSCNNADGNYDYHGTGSKLPYGCQSSRWIGWAGATAGSFDSATAAPPITLSPSATYYLKIVVWAKFAKQDFYAQCFSDMSPFTSACTISPSSAAIPIGGTPVKFTANAYNPGNSYVAPSPITSAVSWAPPTCQRWDPNDPSTCIRGYVPGILTVNGYHFGNTGDYPNIRIMQHNSGTTIYNGSTSPHTPSLTDPSTDYGNISFGTDQPPPTWGSYNPALLTPSDVTVYYNPPTSVPLPNNIDHVSFSQSPAPPPTYISLSPVSPDTSLPDFTSPYEVFVTGVAATNPVTSLLAKIYVKVGAGSQYALGGSCYASISVTPAGAPNPPWWQVKDSDVQTNGNLTSQVPSSQVFDLPGGGTFPGIPAYGGSTNLTNTSVSAKGWLANSPWTNPKVYNYDFFANQIPSDVVMKPITAIDDTQIVAGDQTKYGYAWYKYEGTDHSGQPLTVDAATHIFNKKVVVLVDNADLDINSTINLADGQGFFMVIVKGNIVVSQAVGGGAAPNLEGIYVADGSFSDKIGGVIMPGSDIPLWVRGSVVAYGGAGLLRDLGVGNASPAELFEYAPDQIMLFPTKLGIRKIDWKEVAP